MPRTNDFVKKIVMHTNIFFSMIGVTLFGISFYIIFADWGSLDPGFFLGIGINGCCIAGILFLISSIGGLGVSNQSKIQGLWTGRRIISLYQILLLLCIVAELYSMTIFYRSIADLRVAFESLSDPDNILQVYENSQLSQINSTIPIMSASGNIL
jgi:hypothetical protein